MSNKAHYLVSGNDRAWREVRLRKGHGLVAVRAQHGLTGVAYLPLEYLVAMWTIESLHVNSQYEGKRVRLLIKKEGVIPLKPRNSERNLYSKQNTSSGIGDIGRF
jgi:hypothetical protein